MNNYLKRTILYCALTLILGVALGLLSDLLRHPGDKPTIVERVDTVTVFAPIPVHDTILKEVAVRLPVVRTRVEELRIPLNSRIETDHPHDSLKAVTDTAEILIPITQKEYSDSNYTAWVSGYNPSLDSIRIYRKTVRYQPTKPSRLHLSVGVGAVYNGKLAPGIFIGVSYSFCEIRL